MQILCRNRISFFNAFTSFRLPLPTSYFRLFHGFSYCKPYLLPKPYHTISSASSRGKTYGVLPNFSRRVSVFDHLEKISCFGLFFSYSDSCRDRFDQRYMRNSSLATPSQVYRMIEKEMDPLRALEIFEEASQQPGFQNSYSAYHVLICKLCRAKQFKFVDDLIHRMKEDRIAYTADLFSEIIEIYGEFGMPNEAVRVFHRMLQYECKPLPKHLNGFLTVLLENENRDLAFSIFKRLDEHGIQPDTKSYNMLMRAKCLNDELSHAFFLYNRMRHKGHCKPDAESYIILMQGLCRKGQVKTAIALLDEMVNKGLTAETQTFNTLLNSLCRKKKLREAYRLLCKMKVMGCNPDVLNYNTVITAFCREGRAHDACQVLRDMHTNGCQPNILSYRTLIIGLCNEAMHDEAREFLEEMISKGFAQHISLYHLLITGYCIEGRAEKACQVLELMVSQSMIPHESTWSAILTRICRTRKCEVTECIDNLFRM